MQPYPSLSSSIFLVVFPIACSSTRQCKCVLSIIGHRARYYCPSSKVTKKPLAAREGLQKEIEEQMSDYEGVKERWGREGETAIESG
jgi:hypothetical protein